MRIRGTSATRGRCYQSGRVLSAGPECLFLLRHVYWCHQTSVWFSVGAAGRRRPILPTRRRQPADTDRRPRTRARKGPLAFSVGVRTLSFSKAASTLGPRARKGSRNPWSTRARKALPNRAVPATGLLRVPPPRGAPGGGRLRLAGSVSDSVRCRHGPATEAPRPTAVSPQNHRKRLSDLS